MVCPVSPRWFAVARLKQLNPRFELCNALVDEGVTSIQARADRLQRRSGRESSRSTATIDASDDGHAVAQLEAE